MIVSSDSVPPSYVLLMCPTHSSTKRNRKKEEVENMKKKKIYQEKEIPLVTSSLFYSL